MIDPTHYGSDQAARAAIAEMLPKGGIGVEVGVAYGEHARLLFDIARPKQLVLIDQWGTNPRPENGGTHEFQKYKVSLLTALGEFCEEIADRRVIFHRAASRIAFACYPDDYFDWLYLDSDHAYETVLQDLRDAARVVKGSGVIAGHDFNVVAKNQPKERPIEVYQALVEFTATTPWEVVAVTGPANNRKPAGFACTCTKQ